MTISDISIDVLRYIFNYGSSGEFSAHVLKAGNRFFSNIPSYYPLLLKSLGNKFIDGIQKDDSHLAFESVKYLDYCYIQLMNHEHGIEELEYTTITLELLSEALQEYVIKHSKTKDFYNIFLKDASLLICNLLSRRESVERFMKKEKKALDKQYMEETGAQSLPAERIAYQN